MGAENFVIPSQIPWDRLKGKELEECIYWLIDSMGGKDIEWRIGGKGSGTSDQGRDIECLFYMSNPEGDLSQQKWWVEAKGRSDTVEPSEVKEALINAANKTDIDIFVIATNAQFSNPTRDWVKEWQVRHPRPKVRLWERTTLERLCSQHPIVAVRLFAEALSNQGRLELLRTRLWNYTIISDEPTLKKLWKERDSLNWNQECYLAVIVSECANGNISKRPWGTIIENEDLFKTIALGLLNILYLISRADSVGTSQQPFIQALSYLFLVALDRFESEKTSKFLENVWEMAEGNIYTEKHREFVLGPILGNLVEEVRDVCTYDCGRVSSELVVLNKKDLEQYWYRFLPSFNEGDDEETNIFLTIESLKKPCKVGFELGEKRNCPICHIDHPEKDLLNTLSVISKIIQSRKPESKKDV